MTFFVSRFFRLMRTGFVLAREGALAPIDPAFLPPPARIFLRIARFIERKHASGDSQASAGTSKLARALTRLGPSYVKFGQFLATRPDIIGFSMARELSILQDRMPPFDQSIAVTTVETALGGKLSRFFTAFSEPVAAASVAQVHRATMKDGREIAVKILRPFVRTRFARDLESMAFAARLAERLSAEARRLRFQEIVETLRRSVMVEMDLRLEAAALSELADNTRNDADFCVPEPVWELTGRDVLATQWITATPIHHLEALDAAGHSRSRLAKLVLQSFLTHAIRDGFFHADMHQGNLLVDSQGRLVAVDGGIMGRLGLKERRFLANILLGFITRDYTRVAQVHFDAGYVPEHYSVADFAQALRAVGEPIHNRSADQISMANLLGLLFEITALFDMVTRTELVMLQKTMVVVEGVARTLDPHLDIWQASEPVVSEWLTQQLGFKGQIQDAAGVLADGFQALKRLPDIILRLDTQSRIDADTKTARQATTGDRWYQQPVVPLWIIAGLLLIIVFLL